MSRHGEEPESQMVLKKTTTRRSVSSTGPCTVNTDFDGAQNPGYRLNGRHFVQEEEVLAHMRLLSSEAKDWKSRVVTEAKEVLCRESAQMAHQATEAQEAMDQHYKAKWQQAEADLTALCKSNSAQVQSFASKMLETNAEHQQLHDAQERRIQLEAQAPTRSSSV